MLTVTPLRRYHIDVTDLETVGPDDLVHDIGDAPGPTVTDDDDEEETVVQDTEEATNKRCCIAYEDCLLQLATMKVFTKLYSLFS